jgi:hypothetical protein
LSISHQAILPPIWCALPSDPTLYERPPPILKSPGTILIGENARCICGARYNPTLPVLREKCTIYCLTHVEFADIEVQLCPSCNSKTRHHIGPDPREVGLFNLNNKRLFTYDLLDEYTSAFTSSETPFFAWVSSRSHTYKTYNSPTPFVSEDVFRAAWFAYVQLQNFVNDMSCMICGPNPERVIWDGVTIAYRKEKILPSLQPPTFTSSESPIRDSVRYQPKQQLIQKSDVRQLLHTFLLHHNLKRHCLDVIDERKSTGGAESGLDMNTVEEKLREINTSLGTLFADEFSKKDGSPIYCELFNQVRYLLVVIIYINFTWHDCRLLLKIPSFV